MSGPSLEERLERLNAGDASRLAQTIEFLDSPQGAALIRGAGEFSEALAAIVTRPDGLATGDGQQPPGADAVVQLLERHPAFRGRRELEIGRPLFGEAMDPEASPDPRLDAAVLLADAATALTLRGGMQAQHVDVLLHVAGGADAFSALLRHVLRGKPVRDPSEILIIPPRLSDLAEIGARTCILGLQHALVELGRAAAAAGQPRAWATGIMSLSPSRGCAGTVVTIVGRGFGDRPPPDVLLSFPRRGGGCTPVPASEVRLWSDTEIVVTAPPEVGVGCVGFVFPGGDPSGLVSAASSVAGQMLECFGPSVSPAAERIRGLGALPRVQCPQCLPGGVNRFVGGRPLIHFFRANFEDEELDVVAGDPVELTWLVTNATMVEIQPIRVGGQRHQLPEITTPLDPASGTLDLGPLRGSYNWQGGYELRCFNDCTPRSNPETRRVAVRMRPRRRSFLWGVATAGYQVEGGITNNDWDTFTTNPTIVGRVHAMGSLAGEHLNLIPPGEAVRHGDLTTLRQDLDRAACLGMNAYRFSVEWSRVEPSQGSPSTVLEDYYVPLVRELRQRGMAPVVTLSHLTLPSWVLTPPVGYAFGMDPSSDAGYAGSLRGWESAATVAAYVAYVRRVVARLKDEGVRHWITLNEPVGSVIGVGYIAGIWPPGITLDGPRAKAAYFNLLRAHVQAYDAIKSIDERAQVSIAHNMPFFKARDPGFGGIHVAARNQQEYFYNSHFLNSVTTGTVDKRIYRRRPPGERDPDETSEGFFGIPAADWRPKLDFIGVNYYRAVYAYHFIPIALYASFVGGAFTPNLHRSSEPHHLLTDLGWEISPEGFLETLRTLHADYGLPIMITENGVGEAEERYRPPYTVTHLEQIEQARTEGVQVLGYLHWSLLDNYEWQYNYEPLARFGLYRVDRATTDTSGRAVLARRLTDTALAIQYAITEGAGRAQRRWGSIEPQGRLVTNESMSPGSLWQGAGAGGPRLALYLTPLENGALLWLGMVFDYDARRWIRLDDIIWDPTQGRLSLYHLAKAGVPEREYVAAPTGDRLQGTFTESGTVRPWQVDRVLPHGVWEPSLPFGPFTLSNAGKWEAREVMDADTWTGRLRTPSPGTIFLPLEHMVPMDVSWDGSTLTLGAAIPHPQTLAYHQVRLEATVTRLSMSGTVTATDGFPGLQTGAAWQATRFDDGVPF